MCRKGAGGRNEDDNNVAADDDCGGADDSAIDRRRRGLGCGSSRTEAPGSRRLPIAISQRELGCVLSLARRDPMRTPASANEEREPDDLMRERERVKFCQRRRRRQQTRPPLSLFFLSSFQKKKQEQSRKSGRKAGEILTSISIRKLKDREEAIKCIRNQYRAPLAR